MLKCWNQSITTKNHAVTFYQALEQVSRRIGLIKIKKTSKIFKNVKILWGWGGGGVEGNSGGWGQQWRGLQPLRTALHTISISLQNSFCE